MYDNIVAGIIANLITTLFYTIVGIIIYLVFFVLARQRLLRFFGISNQLPTFRIYLSRLEIKPGGTEGFEPITVGYVGPAINELEYEGALLMRNLFQSRFLGILPKRLQDWLGKRHITLISVDPPIEVSPQNMDLVSFDNLIIVGSSIYNLVSKHYLEHKSSCFYFGINSKGERIFGLREENMKGAEIPGRSIDRELAIVQRINDSEHNNAVFICAGLGSSATFGSVRYLVENWPALMKKYGNEQFAICLAFPNQPADSLAVVQPKVIYSTQI